MVEKLPLRNDFLETVTAIDPVAILAKGTATLKAILHLADIVTNVFWSTDLEDYEKEYENHGRSSIILSTCWKEAR